MSLLHRQLKNPGHITEAVIHFNEALDAANRRRSSVEISRALFDGLNKIQTEWVLHRSGEFEPQIGEIKAFQLMTLEIGPVAREQLLRSPELESVVAFEPQVMNHDTLRRRGYRPDIVIDPALVSAASEQHRKLVTAYLDLRSVKNIEVENRVLKRAAELLYVVRSNIAHGEKTPYGPDLAKRERDERVCDVAVPLQLLLFDLLLDRPSTRLVAYGTLAPGKPNHSFLQDIVGSWEPCQMQGSLTFSKGLPRFSWNPAGAEIDAELFVSEALPEAWRRIDDFEGTAYKRRLVTVSRSVGVSVANVYLASEAT